MFTSSKIEDSQFKSLLIGLFVLFVGFNIWHVSKHGLWDPPSVIHSLTLTPEVAAVFVKVDPAIEFDGKGGNDGQFFYIMSYDPVGVSQKYDYLFDFIRYRRNRVLYPLMTHLVAFGQPKLYPYVLMALDMLFFFLGGFVLYQLCKRMDWTFWVLAGYFTNTGLLFSVFRDMSEPIATTMVILGLWYWLLNRKGWAVGWFAAAILTKEIYLVPPLALFIWEFYRKNLSLKQFIQANALTVLPYVLWVEYVSWLIPAGNAFATLHMAPSWGIGRFSLPFLAMTQEMLWGMHTATTRTVIKLTLNIYIVTVTWVILAFIAFYRRPTLWTALLLLEGIFLTTIRGEIWNYFASSCRQASFFYVLIYFWLADELKNLKTKAS